MATKARDCATFLAQAATTIRPLIRSRVNRLPPQIRHVAGMHFGWWTDVRKHVDTPTGGKAVRPALALLTCQAVGGEPQHAHPAAVAVELVHNASLLHDDIIDQDPLRRGRPTLWSSKGIPAAILAGDALFFAAVQALTEAPRTEATLPVLLESIQALIEGEYLDTLLDADTGTRDRVLAVATAKTGELLACACALGALAAGADAERVRHLRAFGRHIGIAFQCADDLLGIWGDEAVTGKPALSDVRARKITLPVAAALARGGPQAESLRALYSHSEPLSDDACHRAADLIEQTGARAWTLHQAQRHTADALDSLTLAHPAPVPAAELTALAHLLIRRDH